MLFPLSDEQKMIRELVASFVAKEVEPAAKEVDETARFPKEHFDRLGELGLLGILIPREYGGAGIDYLACTIIMEELAKACASTALSYGAHTVICAHNLFRNGSEEQRQRYVPDLATGAKLGAMALTEPNAGSDAVGIQTRAVRRDDRYVLNGSKTFITNGSVASTFVVYAKTHPEKMGRGISAFIVEKGTAGFTVGRNLKKMGMRGSPTSELLFEDCEVPASNLLGKEDEAVSQMMENLDVERVTLSGISLGISRASLEQAAAYARERRQFGQSIGEFQLVQKMLADMATELEAATLLTYHAASVIASGAPLRKVAAMAKLFSSEAATRAALNAIQILGGYGYTSEHSVERFLRDAKLMEIGAGTSEIQRWIIAREILRRMD